MFQLTVDMLTFFVTIVTIVEGIIEEFQLNEIGVVKNLIYAACETYI